MDSLEGWTVHLHRAGIKGKEPEEYQGTIFVHQTTEYGTPITAYFLQTETGLVNITVNDDIILLPKQEN